MITKVTGRKITPPICSDKSKEYALDYEDVFVCQIDESAGLKDEARDS
jgi:hypothetical protein